MLKSDFALLILAVVIGLTIILAPAPGIDCSHYHEHSFHGVTVNCDRQVVRK